MSRHHSSVISFGALLFQAVVILEIFNCTVLATEQHVSIGSEQFDKDGELDCSMRWLALKMAGAILPWRRQSEIAMGSVFDALELHKCKKENHQVHSSNEAFFSEEQRRLTTDPASIGYNGQHSDDSPKRTFHVCAMYGNDFFEGNETHPFASLQRALKATREVVRIYSNPTQAQPHRTIVIHQGIHYLNETIILTPKDSYLTIRSATDGEMPWLSGGILINSTRVGWTPSNKNPNIWVADLSTIIPKGKSVTGLFTVHPHARMTLARYPNANVEDWDAPERYVPSDQVEEWIFPPHGPKPKMFSIDLSQVGNPTGSMKNDSYMKEYNMFGTGQGGVCSTVWGNSPSYWCGNVSAGGWAEVDMAAALAGRLNIPAGMVLKSKASDDSIGNRARRWKNARGAIVHVSHTQGWAWHMFNISTVQAGLDNKTTTVLFDKGGWQGGRNWQCKDAQGHLNTCDGTDKKLSGGDWYVEGILEELDEPGEFFFDVDTRLLYFYPNRTDAAEEVGGASFVSKLLRKRLAYGANMIASSVPPDVVATNLQTLIKVEGTMDDPVRGVHLLGLGFRDAAKTYMEQWSAPSGGDWALHRGGALHIEGAENITISDCTFSRLDGNAVMLSGYSRHFKVARSDFKWIGNGAVATWGDTHDDGYDATGGTQPRFSVMEENLIHDIGLYQKQSSGWGQNKACQTTIKNNVMYNLPRAAINFNDGLGGGNIVEKNVIFNTCRESGDHGPINSWDRMPFLTDVNIIPSFLPLPTHTRKNIIFANYGASQSFDNDDGSSWYYTYSNVFYSADGFKMDYGGHDSRFHNNLIVVLPYDGQNCFNTWGFKKGHGDAYYNNWCILGGARNPDDLLRVGFSAQCSPDRLFLANNKYFTTNGSATWSCGGDNHLTLSEVQQKGLENGSTVHAFPETEQVMLRANVILRD